MRKHVVTRLVISLTLGAVVLTTPAPPTRAASDTFSDDDSNVHESAIEFIATEEITKGCNPPANDRFCPDETISRGQMAAFLARSLGLRRRGQLGFVDSERSIFSDDISAIAAADITKGCNPPTNDRFCPDDTISRGQMAAFLTRAYKLEVPAIDYFTDDSSSIFESDINALAHSGITVGCRPGSYCPSEPVSRAQMASFISRALTGGGEPPTPPDVAEPPSTLPPPGASQPPGSIAVHPGESLASASAKHPAGTTFYLTKGIHRQTYVRPKDRQSFVGAPGAILSGARVLTGFARSEGLWVVGGQTQHNEEKGTCLDGYDGCVHPEQLFIDGKELWQVTSKSEVKPGTWFFDYSADQIYIADDPSGHLVETSVTPVAFDGSAVGVTIRDLVIEKYAAPAQMGAIHGQEDRNGTYGRGWVVQGNEIRYIASSGIALGHEMRVQDNYLHHNGRIGVGSGLAEDAVIESNEISYNCRGTGYLCFGWGGGGVKLAGAHGTMIRSNYVHHNIGAGLHVDVQSSSTTFEGNHVVDNDGSGIFVEVSDGASIRDNVVEKNGFERPEGQGAGIVISASTDVSVTGNELRDNALGIVAYQHDREPGLDRLVVTSNLIVQPDGHNGLRNQTSSGNYFGTTSVTWNNNTYDLGSVGRAFVYESGSLSTAQWIALGYDKNSAFK